MIKKHFSPWRIFLITIGGIFMAEIVAMIVIARLEMLSYTAKTFIDAFIMTALIFPLIYTQSYRPLLLHIRQRQEVEADLFKSNEGFERIFSVTHVLFAHLDRDFNFIRVNRAYAEAGGHPPEFYVGKNHFDLYPHAENEAIFRRVVETGEPYHVFEKPFTYPEFPERGVTYWDWSLQPVKEPDGRVSSLILSLVDVTERKKAQLALAEERERLFYLLNQMPAFVYLRDPDHIIRFANSRFKELFGETTGRRCFELRERRDSPCPECPAEIVFQTKQPQQWEWTSANGRSYQIFDYPFSDVDGSQLVLKMGIDITERKLAEKQLERNLVELQTLTKAERQARQVAETLCAATQSLTRSLDLETVMEALLSNLEKLIPYDSALIALLEENERLAVHASRGYELWSDPLQVRRLSYHLVENSRLREMLTTQGHLLIDDTATFAGWTHPPGLGHVRSWLGVAIIVEGKLIGLCGLDKIQPGFFTQEHIQLAQALVNQAAVAIQNAWLFAQVRSGSERLQSLAHELVRVQEKERFHIARELHDHAGQALSSLKLSLGRLEQDPACPMHMQQRLRELKGVTDSVLEDLHRLAMDLRPVALDHLGLVAALQQFSHRLDTEQLNVHFKSEGFNGERLPSELEISLYRIAQEALTNVVCHAQASNVGILLERNEQGVRLFIEDDGIGFSPESVALGESLGLLGMRERAEMLGGRLTIESAPGMGTSIIVEVPYGHPYSDRR